MKQLSIDSILWRHLLPRALRVEASESDVFAESVSPDFGGQAGEQILRSDHVITQLSIAIGSNGFKYERNTLQKSAYGTIHLTP